MYCTTGPEETDGIRNLWVEMCWNIRTSLTKSSIRTGRRKFGWPYLTSNGWNVHDRRCRHLHAWGGLHKTEKNKKTREFLCQVLVYCTFIRAYVQVKGYRCRLATECRKSRNAWYIFYWHQSTQNSMWVCWYPIQKWIKTNLFVLNFIHPQVANRHQRHPMTASSTTTVLIKKQHLIL